MLRFVASFFISDTDPNTYEENTQEPFFPLTTMKNIDFHEIPSDEVEQLKEMDIQSLRQQKLQELAQKVILRKLARQAVMNQYSQDHVPLSQIQEKLEEDDLPLSVLQDRLNQNESPSFYTTITTIRENINFLLYGKPSKSKKPRQRPSNVKTNDNITNNSNAVTYTPKDDRDYDVWDDAIIGRLMNLIDTVGVEVIQEEASEGNTIPKVNSELVDKVVKKVMKEVFNEGSPSSSNVNNKKKSTFSSSKESTKGTVKKEKIVAESSSAAIVGKNAAKNKEDEDIKRDAVKIVEKIMEDVENDAIHGVENEVIHGVENDAVHGVENDDIKEIKEEETKLESIKIAEEIIDFGETINVAESLLRTDNLTTVAESLTSTKSVKRESRFRRAIFPLGHSPTPSSNKKNPVPIPKSLKRNISDLSRRGSIHSRKSYDNDISRRSSISSKISVNTTATEVIIEDPNEDGSDYVKLRKRTTTKSNKSLQFFKGLWKNNQNLPLANNNSEEFILNKEIMEKHYQKDNELHRNRVGHEGITGINPDTGYSNFYLSMPNGKWMVRTRTASRKITGTQYIDKEYI